MLHVTGSSIRKRTVVAVIWCSLTIGVALAQTMDSPPVAHPQRGFYPGGSYSLSDIESVDDVSGNVILKIPVAKLPPGRGGSSFAVDLIYNSAI